MPCSRLGYYDRSMTGSDGPLSEDHRVRQLVEPHAVGRVLSACSDDLTVDQAMQQAQKIMEKYDRVSMQRSSCGVQHTYSIGQSQWTRCGRRTLTQPQRASMACSTPRRLTADRRRPKLANRMARARTSLGMAVRGLSLPCRTLDTTLQIASAHWAGEWGLRQGPG